jgi:hypothetical protein
MLCVWPPELDGRELLTYVDGEADLPVVAHLERCQYCREKAHRLARVQERLIDRLYRLTCPTPAELGEYHLDLLPGDQASAVNTHLTDCPHCSQEFGQLKDYLTELTPDVANGSLRYVRAHASMRVAEQSLLPTIELLFADSQVADTDGGGSSRYREWPLNESRRLRRI